MEEMASISECNADSDIDIKPVRSSKRKKNLTLSSGSESETVINPRKSRIRKLQTDVSPSGSEFENINSVNDNIAHLPETDSKLLKATPRRSNRKANRPIVAKASLPLEEPLSLNEMDQDEDDGRVVTRRPSSTPDSTNKISSTNTNSNANPSPRSSSRLKALEDKRGTFQLPNRKEVLDVISPSNSTMKIARKFQPKKLVNNFITEKHSYNRDRVYDSDEYDADDFIVDDNASMSGSSGTSCSSGPDKETDSEEESDTCLKKNTKHKKNQIFQTKSKKNHIFKPKSKAILSSSSEDESDLKTSCDSKIRRKKRIGINISNSDASDISDAEKFHSKSEANIRLGDECCSEQNESQFTNVKQAATNSDLLSRKSSRTEILKRQQHGKRESKLQALKQKRELAKLPLDKRKEAEEKFKQEKLEYDFNLLDEETNESASLQHFDNSYCEHESDREFIVSCTDSEDEHLDDKRRTEFNEFLQHLAKSDRTGSEQSTSFQDQIRLSENEAINRSKTNIAEDSPAQLQPYSVKVKLKGKNSGRHKKVLVLSDSEDDSVIKLEPCVKYLFNLIQNKDINISCLKDALRDNVIPINSKGEKGRTVLHLESIGGNLEILELFLENNASPDVIDDYGLSPVCYAALWKNDKCLKALIRVADLAGMQRNIHKNMEGMSLLHVITLDGPKTSNDENEKLKLECLRIVKDYNKKMYDSMLSKKDVRGYSPLIAALSDGHAECVKQFINDGANFKNYQTDYGGNILHFAVESAGNDFCGDKASCLRVILPYLLERIDDADVKGFTPLMYASEMANVDCIKALLDYGASLKCKDDQGTTSLHLAAASGNTQCIELLISSGHEVDCLDNSGWPPLLYANFQACESCVIALMKAKPEQLFVLSNLLINEDEIQKRKNMEVVKSTILSLANQDAYYTIFNDFIRQNTLLLDDGSFLHTWKAILDFDNKYSWFKRQLKKTRRSRTSPNITVDRRHVLESAMVSLCYTDTFCIEDFNITFKDEPGQCTGPKREFLSCFCNDVIKPERKLFQITDDRQYSPVPNAYFLKFIKGDLTPKERISIVGNDTKTTLSSEVNQQENMQGEEDNEKIPWRFQLQGKLEELQFIGKLVAACIADGWNIQLPLAKSFINQILNVPLNHPENLQSFDNLLYKNAVEWVLETDIDDMFMPFSHSENNPWDNYPIEVNLGDDQFNPSMLTDANKEEFVKRISKFKLQISVQKETQAFKTGFYEEINADLIGLFNADEFSLILNGVQHIDVSDWKKHTKYSSWCHSDNVIIWFWNTLESLKEEEKALLLKFSTGTPCVPVGGFKELTGLGTTMGFTIGKTGSNNKIPCAQTCFNLLQLSDYESEKLLREKLLIAIRYGSEGFSFG